MNAQKEITYTNIQHVSCHGLEEPYDHPMIYLEIDKEIGKVECPYCSRTFVLKKSS
jgi:uncharacterized Zn-finger protein